jgi:hypothetical protein
MKCWWMNKQNRKFGPAKYLFVVISLSYFFFTSCQKDSGVGSNVLPASQIISAFVSDTTTIISSIKLKDSIITNSLSVWPLGSYFDPVFGMTKSSIYTQVVPPGGASSFAFGTGGYELDSVVLYLPVQTVYGTLSPQTYTVDTILDNPLNSSLPPLVLGKTYYSDTNISHGTNHIGLVTAIPAVIDSIRYGTYSTPLGGLFIKIKLNNSFGHYIMRTDSSTSSYTSNFGNLLKGLFISISNPGQLPGQGGIVFINPSAAGTGLTFYYKINGLNQQPQTFLLGTGVSFCHFDHDYSTTPFYNGGKDSVLSPNICYVQTLGGVKTQLSFPYLSNWKKLGHIIINEAAVIIPVNTSATGADIPPPQAYLVRDSAGHQFALSDESLTSYGGTYDPFNHWYIFNLARYFQGVIDGKITDTGLYFISGSEGVTANGAVLYGASKNNLSLPRIRLKMYYTPLKH